MNLDADYTTVTLVAHDCMITSPRCLAGILASTTVVVW